jgi:O-antigen ligase
LAYAALLLYVAILFIRPQEWVVAIRGFPILDYVVGVALVTWLGSAGRKESQLRKAPQTLLMGGLFLAALLSHVRHTYFAALIETGREFGKVVLIYFLVATLVTSAKKARLLVLVMLIGCLFLSAHGITQAQPPDYTGFGGLVARFTTTRLPTGEVIKTPRVWAFGIFHDPNDLALMLVAMLPFLFATVLDKTRGAGVRAFSAAATVPILYCIYLTNSRGGWLALGVMGMTYIYLRAPSKKMATVLAVVALAGAVALGPSRIATISAEEGSAHGRLIAWGHGNQMLKQWPIFGAGWLRFTEFSTDNRAAHNSFLQAWAEMGLLGYFFWLGMAIASLKDGYALASSPAEPDNEEARQLKFMGQAALAGLVGFFAAAFFLSRTYNQPLFIMFALIAALRCIYEREVAPLEHSFKLRDSKLVLAAELVSIPAMYVLIRLMN